MPTRLCPIEPLVLEHNQTLAYSNTSFQVLLFKKTTKTSGGARQDKKFPGESEDIKRRRVVQELEDLGYA